MLHVEYRILDFQMYWHTCVRTPEFLKLDPWRKELRTNDEQLAVNRQPGYRLVTRRASLRGDQACTKQFLVIPKQARRPQAKLAGDSEHFNAFKKIGL